MRSRPTRARTPEPVRPAIHPAALAAEVAALPRGQVLVERRDLRVLVADAAQIPSLLQEIGRLREITFRAAGEGTGRELDLDRFDRSYRHLFAWSPERGEVVGAYRVGDTARLQAAGGVGALYTSTLFEYDAAFLARLGPALELGRSFVRPEYQRSSTALMALWKGLGQLVAAQPECRILFGPVSIPARYSAMSRAVISAVLARYHGHPDLATEVRPRNPFEGPPVPEDLCDGLSDPEALARAVAEIEHDGKALPTLVREYLRLGGRFLAFNVDPDFSEVLDGLVAVDLLATEPRLLSFYMGSEAARAFRAHHGAA